MLLGFSVFLGQMCIFIGTIILMIIMGGAFACLFIITSIVIIYMPLVVITLLCLTFIIETGLAMRVALGIAFGGVIMFVGSDVLIKITFLMALVIEIGIFFIFILVVDFMKAAGLLSLFVVRRLPVAAALLVHLGLIVPSIIPCLVVISLFVSGLGIVMP